MYITPQEYEVQSALNQFWDANYTRNYSSAYRSLLAAEFSDKWLNPSKIKIDKQFIRHPATRKRERSRSCTVADVLADFVMRVDQVAERQQEFPISNPDKSVNGKRERSKKERGTFFQYEMDAMKEGDVMPTGLVTEDKLADQSIEDILFADVAPDIEEFRKELRRIKRKAEFHATTFAEKYGYKRKDALRKIRALDLTRVRECNICGSAFYAHDRRRHVCDMQQGVVTYKEGGRWLNRISDKSTCELENERKSAKNRAEQPILAEEKSII